MFVVCTGCAGTEKPPPIFADVHPQSWADAFRSSPSLSGVVYVYDDLRRRGLEFPMTDLDAMSPIHTPNRVRLTPLTPPPQNWRLPRHGFTISTAYRVFQKTEVRKFHLMSLAHGSRLLKHLPVFPVITLHLQPSQLKDQSPFLHNRYNCQSDLKSGLTSFEFIILVCKGQTWDQHVCNLKSCIHSMRGNKSDLQKNVVQSALLVQLLVVGQD